tara:strand:+ start:1311 stop:1817 length:507 start_codon:yes stop_codon:yes gene_type:complete
MGFKKTSELIAVSFGLTESAPGVFTQDEIALQLDVLNNEIAVVLAVDLDLTSPDAVAATNTRTEGCVTSTSQTAITSLSNTNTMAVARQSIRAAGFVDGGVSFDRSSSTTPTGDLDYVALIATNNFFVQVQGVNNIGAKTVTGRVWLYRAKSDSATYAALVQSEVLSA